MTRGGKHSGNGYWLAGGPPGFITINDNTPYNIQIVFSAGTFNIYMNDSLVATCTDNNYGSRAKDVSHTKIGLGARCGAQHAEHIVSNLTMANAVP